MQNSVQKHPLLFALWTVASLPAHVKANINCTHFPVDAACFTLPATSTLPAATNTIANALIGTGETLTNLDITATGRVSNVTLGGVIRNKGTLSNVRLLPGAIIIGGTLTGNINGSATGPALLSNVKLGAAHVSNVLIDAASSLSAATQLTQGVFIASENLLPAGIVLGTAAPLASNNAASQPTALDLTGEVTGTTNWLEQITSYLKTAAPNAVLTQTSAGLLNISIDSTTYLLAATDIRKATPTEAQGISVTPAGQLQLITPGQRRFTFASSVQEAATFKQQLKTTANLSIASIAANGMLQAVTDPTMPFYTLRPDLGSETATLMNTPGLYLLPFLTQQVANVNAAFYFFTDTEGNLRQQALPAMPGDWDSLSSTLSALKFSNVTLQPDGVINATYADGTLYRAVANYQITPGPAVADHLTFDNSVGDLNQDGINDLGLIYPNGDRQGLVLLESKAPSQNRPTFSVHSAQDMAQADAFLLATAGPAIIDIALNAKEYSGADITLEHFEPGDKIRFKRADGLVQPGAATLHSATANQYFSSLETDNFQRTDAIIHAQSQAVITLLSSELDVAHGTTTSHSMHIYLTGNIKNKDLQFEFI